MADRPVRSWLPILSKTSVSTWTQRLAEPSTIFLVPDLFMVQYTDEARAAVFAMMAATPQHQYIVSTLYTDRGVAWFAKVSAQPDPERYLREAARTRGIELTDVPWVPSNIALGAVVRSQAVADKLVPPLLTLPVRKFIEREWTLSEEVSFDAWKPAACTCKVCTRGVSTCAKAKFPIDWVVTAQNIQDWPPT